MKHTILKKKAEAEKLQCSYWDFQTVSKQGLKTHLKRKHTSYNLENYPMKCTICEEEMKNKEEMKDHMVTHSYIDTTDFIFKCEDCDFWGPNSITMKVHNQKSHGEQKSCGLCNHEFSENENLETHLFTCEIYKCDSCSQKFKSLPDIKGHISEEHKRNTVILHSKINRDNSEHAVEMTHYSKDLFRKS